MPDVSELWFDSPPGATCVSHGRGADSVCSRCGAFQCELCITPTAKSFCQPCAVVLTSQSLPALSTRAAWKLIFLPLVGIACLLTLAAKGAPLRSLNQEQIAFLVAWLIPFACGLGLVPPLVADFSGQRVLDLVLLGAAPLVALRDAFAIDRAHRHRVLLATMATA